MAILPEAERMEIWRWMALPNREGEIDSLRRVEFRAAIDAADDWLVANAGNFNSALPQPARGVLTPPQKALLLGLTARRRALIKPSAELSDEERDNIARELVSKSRDPEVASLEFADILAAVDATDDWIVEHAGDFNQALPQPARGVLTIPQKARTFALVAEWRWRVDA